MVIKKTTIISGCATPMTSPIPDKQFYELVYEASKCALDKIGLSRYAIDFTIVASYDHIDGRMISNMYTSMAAGGYLKYESRIADDGLLALAYADAMIRSGEADIGVVAGFAARETDHVYASNLVMDPFFYRPLAMNYLAGLALQASAYLDITRLHDYWDLIAAHIVSVERKQASKNPRAHLREPLEPSDVVESDYVIWPLREAMVPPETRGAVALVVADEETGRRYGLEGVAYIDSIRWYTDNYYIGSKLLYILGSLAKASREALLEAGVSDPAKDIDLFEISDVTPAHYLMELEALGLAPPGRAAKLLEKNEVGPDSSIIVNRSGGSLATDPYPATGLLKAYEAYLQLMGDAGPVQLDTQPRRALIHGFSYIAGASSQTHIVAILSSG